ncbi:hypothetical protein [Burkholderia cepacia]|uniref:hypothetical protein n=1 Tax=Burkholderia cepacia TaxID=292 RepID=UPI0012D8EFBF|nr:hypothetical protein [Burkholderia cepacia]
MVTSTGFGRTHRSGVRQHATFDGQTPIAFSYWTYARGHHEIDDDIWGLFVTAPIDNSSVIADIENARLSTGKFVKEDVDFRTFE